MGTPLYVTLSLAAFKILFLSLNFGDLIMMCLGVDLFGSNLFGTLCFHVCFLSQIREVFFHYFFQVTFQFLAFPLLLGTSMIQMLAFVFVEMSHSLLKLNSHFFEFLFLHVVLMECLFLVFQIIDLNPGFLPWFPVDFSVFLFLIFFFF